MTRNDATECSPWFPPPGTPAGSALPSSGSAEMRSPASTVLWRRPTPCAPRAGLGCRRPAIPCGASVGSLPAVQTRGRGPGVRRPVPTSGECPQGGSQGLSGSRAIHCPYALFFDPGRTEHARPLRRVGVAPAMSTAKAPARFQLSRLNRTALGLAVYASPGAVTRTRRKTRFRPLAKRYRTGLVTRRVPSKGFRIASCDSSSFPKFPGARTSRVPAHRPASRLISRILPRIQRIIQPVAPRPRLRFRLFRLLWLGHLQAAGMAVPGLSHSLAVGRAMALAEDVTFRGGV